ncbi:hypothetical protein HK102_008689 [Quaeritorhiza haematococci]|nr:hypothetical protein HK102_008689 [Quaeritorhiza haematococci]
MTGRKRTSSVMDVDFLISTTSMIPSNHIVTPPASPARDLPTSTAKRMKLPESSLPIPMSPPPTPATPMVMVDTVPCAPQLPRRRQRTVAINVQLPFAFPEEETDSDSDSDSSVGYSNGSGDEPSFESLQRRLIQNTASAMCRPTEGRGDYEQTTLHHHNLPNSRAVFLDAPWRQQQQQIFDAVPVNIPSNKICGDSRLPRPSLQVEKQFAAPLEPVQPSPPRTRHASPLAEAPTSPEAQPRCHHPSPPSTPFLPAPPQNTQQRSIRLVLLPSSVAMSVRSPSSCLSLTCTSNPTSPPIASHQLHQYPQQQHQHQHHHQPAQTLRPISMNERRASICESTSLAVNISGLHAPSFFTSPPQPQPHTTTTTPFPNDLPAKQPPQQIPQPSSHYNYQLESSPNSLMSNIQPPTQIRQSSPHAAVPWSNNNVSRVPVPLSVLPFPRGSVAGLTVRGTPQQQPGQQQSSRYMVGYRIVPCLVLGNGLRSVS